MSGQRIIEKLDEFLKDDKLDTRAGLRFMGELVKDAFQYIERKSDGDKVIEKTIELFEGRIKAVETQLNNFLHARAEEQIAAAEERKFYRRTVIGGILTILLSQVAQWLLR